MSNFKYKYCPEKYQEEELGNLVLQLFDGFIHLEQNRSSPFFSFSLEVYVSDLLVSPSITKRDISRTYLI